MEILIPFVMTLLVGVIEGAQEEGRNLVQEDFVQIAIYGGIMFVLGLVSLASGVLGGKLASEASAGFAANLRQDAYDKIQTFSFANIDRFSTSSLITRLTTDITSVQMSFQMSIRMLVRAPVMFIFASVMSFIIEPQIAWIFLVAAAILFVFVLLIMNARAAELSADVQKVRPPQRRRAGKTSRASASSSRTSSKGRRSKNIRRRRRKFTTIRCAPKSCWRR